MTFAAHHLSQNIIVNHDRLTNVNHHVLNLATCDLDELPARANSGLARVDDVIDVSELGLDSGPEQLGNGLGALVHEVHFLFSGPTRPWLASRTSFPSHRPPGASLREGPPSCALFLLEDDVQPLGLVGHHADHLFTFANWHRVVVSGNVGNRSPRAQFLEQIHFATS